MSGDASQVAAVPTIGIGAIGFGLKQVRNVVVVEVAVGKAVGHEEVHHISGGETVHRPRRAWF